MGCNCTILVGGRLRLLYGLDLFLRSKTGNSVTHNPPR